MSYKPKSTARIAEATGVSENEAEKKLESMADKGVIFLSVRMGRNSTGWFLSFRVCLSSPS